MKSAVFVTENLRNTVAAVSAMQQANKVLQKQHRKIDIDKFQVRVSDIVEFEIRPLSLTKNPSVHDEMEQVDEIQESLG
jgi:ribosomal protein S17